MAPQAAEDAAEPNAENTPEPADVPLSPREAAALQRHFIGWLGLRPQTVHFQKFAAGGEVLYMAVAEFRGQQYRLFRDPGLSDVWVPEGALSRLPQQ